MTALLQLESRGFRECFDRRPFLVRHRLDGHPLFDLRRLAVLAGELPPEKVEYNAGDVPVDLDPSATPRNGLSAEETVRRIEACRSWMVLKNVERAPGYAALLDDCLAEIRTLSDGVRPGMHLAEAFVFVSSPGSVTPFHIDPEHNFLFQIRGTKTIYMFDPADRDVVGETDLERFYGGGHRNLRFRDEWQSRAMRFDLRPGQGVHVPVTAPHWVRNSDGVSVSFSVTFRSRHSRRCADVYQMNHRLRRFGWRPAPAGGSLVVDVLKQYANRALRSAARLQLQLRQQFARRART